MNLKLFIPLILLSTPLWAQVGSFAGADRVIEQDLSNNASPLGFLTQINIEDYNKLSGSKYLSNDWLPSTLISKNGFIYENIISKINLYDYTVDIKDRNYIRLVPINEIDSIIIHHPFEERTIHNAGKYEFWRQSNLPLIGFSEKLTFGSYNLLKVYAAVITKSSYNEALDLGIKGDVITIKENYVLIDKNQKYYEIRKNRNQLFDLIPISKLTKTNMRDFIKSNGLSVKKESDLIIIINKLNSEL
ncbi:MAG: hypothetical protein ACJA08_001621 [Cyclobacteriaceae bacterium]|jgi:hypothetical protein